MNPDFCRIQTGLRVFFHPVEIKPQKNALIPFLRISVVRRNPQQ